jgi:diaminopimelate epimerase
MKLAFSKYHGLGNDFILMHESEAAKVENRTDLIVKACDRHCGIGADGMIFVKQDPLEMIYYNQDGSRAPMCGNGIRCFSAFCKDEGVTDQKQFDVQTLAGIKNVTITNDDPFTVSVYMGQGEFTPEKIGVDLEQVPWNYPLSVLNTTKHIYSFFMSTVHTVLFCEDAFKDIEQEGKAICMHPLFSEQTNVNFTQVIDRHTLKVQTYERGCGVTLACGTGVCAAALTAYKLGLTDSHMRVILKKGALTIDIDQNLGVTMSGPAALVCKGEYDYDLTA